jgi:branched-chain amino acid transport system permease protein
MRLRIGVGIVIGAALVILPFYVPSNWQNLLIMTFYYAYLGQAWNVLGGYAGQLSLGHAAFFAIGAYTSAVLAVNFAVSPWLGMFAGAALAAILSQGVGYLGFRFGLRGFYFILLTLAVAEICRLIALHLSVLGGYTGLFINFSPNPWQFQFQGKIPYYFIALGFLCVACGVVWLIQRSKLGAYLVAIREDEDASEALGVDTFRCKMIAYAVSAALTALGGTFYAYYQFYLQPNTVLHINQSVDIMIRPIVGGAGTILGPVLGSLLLELLGEFSRAYFAGGTAGLTVVIYGILLVIVVLFLPRGVYPTLAHLMRRRHPRKSA